MTRAVTNRESTRRRKTRHRISVLQLNCRLTLPKLSNRLKSHHGGERAAPAEDASMSVWQWIAGAGVLMLITAMLLIMCRSIASFGARAQRGTKTIQRRNALSPALVSDVRGRSARSFNPGPHCETARLQRCSRGAQPSPADSVILKKI